MIRYLHHSEIDKERWDYCISNSNLPVVYMLSWYLDIVAPQWDALVKDDYRVVMPLMWRKKGFIKYVFQPLIVQQSGVFTVTKKNPDRELVNEFINAIPRQFRYLDYSLNETIALEHYAGNHILRKNHVLPIDKSYDAIASGYSRRCRRNLNKANQCKLHEYKNFSPAEAVDFLRLHLKKKIPAFNNYYHTLQHIIESAIERDMGSIIGAVGPGGEITGLQFNLHNHHRCTMVICAITEFGHYSESMYFIIDRIIRKYAGQLKELDFFGSNIPSVEFFNLSFGVETRYYARIKVNRLPFYLRLLKR